MSTRCVRYIQSCVAPVSQSVKHTHLHVHSLAHAQHDDVPLDCRERALVCWVRSPAHQMNAAPQLRGQSHTHTHALTHTHARASGHLRSVFVSLCCWRWWWGSPLAFSPQKIHTRCLGYSHWFGLVLLKRHAFGLDGRVLKHSSQPLTLTRIHSKPSQTPPGRFLQKELHSISLGSDAAGSHQPSTTDLIILTLSRALSRSLSL